MIPMESWREHLARLFSHDSLLSPERLTEYRQHGQCFLCRDDQDLAGHATMIPLNGSMGVIHGFWIADGELPETERKIGHTLIQSVIKRFGAERTIIVPQAALPYIDDRTLTPREAGLEIRTILEYMTEAGVPKRHPLRHASFRVIPRRPVVSHAEL